MLFEIDDHKQIVIGSLLGSGFICHKSKNAYLCMRHSSRHFPWLQSKALELQSYQSDTPWYRYKTTYTWRSRSDPLFTELVNLCYPHGRKEVCMEWLDQLRALGIAVWYGDSGCLVGRNSKNACLRTTSFGKKGNDIIAQYFNEVGIPCNVNKSRNSYIIVFTIDGTRVLTKMIAPYLPSNRYFKIVTG